MPLFFVVALVVALGLLVSTATTMVLNWGILKDQLWSWPEPKVPDGPDPLDLIKVALLVTGGIGGAVALTVAYRKQKWAEEDIAGKRSAYASAATQLGDPSATVRLAGVYALANLADAWPEQRQQCVDVLCGQQIKDHALQRHPKRGVNTHRITRKVEDPLYGVRPVFRKCPQAAERRLECRCTGVRMPSSTWTWQYGIGPLAPH